MRTRASKTILTYDFVYNNSRERDRAGQKVVELFEKNKLGGHAAAR